MAGLRYRPYVHFNFLVALGTVTIMLQDDDHTAVVQT
jgi:hypothetical protein